MMIQNILFATATSLVLMSCGSAESKTTQSNAVVAEKEAAAEQAPAAYVNGITDANSKIPAGPVSLKGKFDVNGARGKVYLYESEGKQHFIIDSTEVVNNTFDFGTKEYEVGFYMLALNQPQNMVGFIINPNEKNVELGFKSARLENGLYSVNSKENEGWVTYYAAEKAAEAAKKGYRSSAKNSPMKAKFEQLIEAEDQKMVDLQKKLIGDYPGTFLAKIMTWKQSPYENDKEKYWADIDFSDESIIRTPIIPDRVQEYMRAFSGGTESGFIQCIRTTADYATASDRVKSFTVLTMLEGFYSSGKEDICAWIMEEYIYGDDCGDGDYVDKLQKRAQGIRDLQIGSVPPDFNITSINGGTINLQGQVANNQYTLVMFWSSWCHKCEQEIPTLKTVYDQFKGKGFQVVGVSVDTQRHAWEKASAEHDIPWPNVSQLNGWDSPVAKDYRVSQTPTLFLLNNKREIVLKPERIFHVRDYLNKNLK